MTAPELHPDDLLDREARALLTHEEQARLDAHLAVCPVCRFEREVRADFRAEFAALADPRSDEAPAPRAATALARTSGLRRRRARARVLGALAVTLLVAGGAAAELGGTRIVSYIAKLGGVSRPNATVPSAAPAARRPRALQRPRSEAVQPAPSLASSPEPTSSAPSAEATPAPSSAPATRERARSELADQGPVLPPATASTLFDEARLAREHGDYVGAVELYQRLLSLFPSSPQALTTQAVLGRLLLDRGAPAQALAHFDAYLASGATTLSEEAALGRALSLGRLGRTSEEAAAWQHLLRAYPGSLYAPRARERLGSLTAE